MKTVKIGKYEQHTTCIWHEPIEIEIPDDMTVKEYLDSLDEEAAEELHERMYDTDIAKDKIVNEDSNTYEEYEDGQIEFLN